MAKKVITTELARYSVIKKPSQIDGQVIDRVEMVHMGKDRVQHLKIYFLDGSHIQVTPEIGTDMLIKVDCSGVYSEQIGEIEIN